MHIRPATVADLDLLFDIDGTIESEEYLHLDRTGEGFSTGWKLELRPLRSKLIESNVLNEDRRFLLRQIVTGADEGLAIIAEHNDAPVALALAQARPEHQTMHLLDLRVDYDVRRQGVATVLLAQIIQAAKDAELRAVYAETRTNNIPASRLLQKLSFEIAGIDTHRHSNHDMVKETATVLWYAPIH